MFSRSAPYPALVVKASGLAAGKGVVVAADRVEACAAATRMLDGGAMGGAGTTVVVEELLEGTEVSVSTTIRGRSLRFPMAPGKYNHPPGKGFDSVSFPTGKHLNKHADSLFYWYFFNFHCSILSYRL